VTGIAPYTTELAEHLAGRGHNVTVATTFPHYPHWKVQPPYSGLLRGIERRGGVEVRRSPVVMPKKGSAIWRISYDTSLAIGSFLNAVNLPRQDLVLCVTPPTQLAISCAALARAWDAPLVLLVKDLPIDAAKAVGLLKSTLVIKLGRMLERLAYRLADRIIVISPGFYRNLVRQGVPGDRIVEIGDWVDIESVSPLPPDRAMRDLLGAGQNDFLVVHTGNMGEKQGLINVVRAAQQADTSIPLKFALVGDGSERPMLEELVARDGPDNIRLLPLQPAEVFPRLLGSADALLLNQRTNIVDSVAPSKLLNYLAAGRPILAAVHPGSEAATLVRQAGCGLLVDPESPAALTEAAVQLASDAGMRATFGENGRRFVEARYGRDSVLARYEAFLTRVAASKSKDAISRKRPAS